MAGMEFVMEKIRSKASQYKSFAECAKALRMSQLEKRFPMDLADRNQLQKCLDTLQQSMKVTTLQGMVERLESISRQASLKLMAGQTGLELFISSDMFYLEVSLEPSGNVRDVKVHHEGKPEQQSCEELVKALSAGDFDDFTIQLQGLISIYQLNAEKKVKCKAFGSLCALEADMDALWSLQSSMQDVQTLLDKSPVGVLEKRRGGHPMKLTYFVSPYDVLQTKKELTIDLINKIGCSVTICLEGSAAHKLQTCPLVNKASGKSSPVYMPMSSTNSTTLPAYFVLKLNKPQPVCLELVKQINAITELECCDTSNPHPLFSLITQHVSNGKMDSSLNRGLFVNLPDQVHCYFMTECKGLDGAIVSSIPFTHPSHVPQILNVLRQQVVFNVLVSSIVRLHSKHDVENMIMLEITALSCRHISVSFEHPLQESMSTVEIDLTDVSSVIAKLYSTSADMNVKTSCEQVSRIMQRCLSIPVTMRYLIKTLQIQQAETNHKASNNGDSSAPGLGGGDHHSPMDASKIKEEPGMGNGLNGKNGVLGSQFEDFSSFSNSVLDGPRNSGSTMADQVKKKRKHEKHWKQRSMDEGETFLESSSNDSLGTPMEIVPEQDVEKEGDDFVDLGDAISRNEVKMKKPKEAKKSPSRLIVELGDGKGLVPPGVTITPITSSAASNMNAVLERRPGIEIIPLSNPAPSALSNSITITPIPGSGDKDERRHFKNPGFEDKMREKKKKRKRDEEGSKMGPPEKVPAKSDPLSKPVSVSIKPATDSPPNSSRPNSPSVRKYAASPTHFREKGSVQRKPSPASSPKHGSQHGSPKQTCGSSGKPSMSALKSASGSPNGSKGSDTKSKSLPTGSIGGKGTPSVATSGKEQRDTSRKNLNSSPGSPKIKSSSVKLKQLDEGSSSCLASSVSSNAGMLADPKNAGNPSQRNRKGSLSAVIDKLKSNAQEASDIVGPDRSVSNGANFKDSKMVSVVSSSSFPKLTGGPSSAQKTDGQTNPAEYMVKHSSDGMKITINKTRSKEGSQSGKKTSGTGSPKTHTGLKPGVSSGPASKKPSSSKLNALSALKSCASKSSAPLKPTSSKSLSGRSTASPTPGSAPSKDNIGKPRISKIGPGDKIFKDKIRKSCPASSQEDTDKVLKTLKMESGLPPSLGLELIKPLPFDTKYQIPKLSARNKNANDSGDAQPVAADPGDSIGLTGTSNNGGNAGNEGSGSTSCKSSADKICISSPTGMSMLPTPPSACVTLVSAVGAGGGIGNNDSHASNNTSIGNSSSTGGNNGGNNSSSGSSSSSSSNSSNNNNNNNNNNNKNNNNNNNVKNMGENMSDKAAEIKIIEITSSKSSLDMAANLKYQASKNDSDRLAKTPNSNVPNLLSLPIALPTVSPKLPMTSPNLPTTSLSSITSKLDRTGESDSSGTATVETSELTPCVTEVSPIKFPSTSASEESKKSGNPPRQVVLPARPAPDDMLDFSLDSDDLSAKMASVEKSINVFAKPGSPVNKSPARSPVNVPSQSPQSITDDELMDEALMLRK